MYILYNIFYTFGVSRYTQHIYTTQVSGKILGLTKNAKTIL